MTAAVAAYAGASAVDLMSVAAGAPLVRWQAIIWLSTSIAWALVALIWHRRAQGRKP